VTALVSIGMPVFNGERYLEATLASLLGQTHAEFELVIADNASTDATREICLATAARDDRVRYVGSDENRGATWNFNRAFTLTTGEYFKWAAYDDLCGPAFLARCLDALAADSGAVLAYPKTRLIDEEGVTVADHEDGLALGQTTPHERLAALVPALGYANPVYGVIRASALRQTRLLGAYPTADYVLLAELALLGRFVEVPERLFLRRVHPAMSRQANPDARSAASWFRPEAGARHRSEAWRLVGEHLRSIGRAPLPPGERLRCWATFARVGGRRYSHHLVRELRELLPARAVGSHLTAVRRPR
jgi:glycosyltransferase involved in cell wall biosynthesis